MIKYLTGVSNELTRQADRADLGLLGTPAGATWRQRDHYPFWAADNGCFAEMYRPGAFSPIRWLDWLELAGPENCLWATLPDVVGDAYATWERSEPYVKQVRNLGFRPSVVLQDGLTDELFDRIIDQVSDVFIGGSTEWKLGAARHWAICAKQCGLNVHVGRVNSLKRLRYSESCQADTADGTYLNYGRKADREANTQRLFRWLDELNAA